MNKTYTLDEYLLEQDISGTSIADLDCAQLIAESNVIGTMIAEYTKRENILRYMEADGIKDVNEFDIFTESADGDKEDGFVSKLGKGIMKWIKKALAFIKSLIDKVINFFKNIFSKEGRLKRAIANNPDLKVKLPTELMSKIVEFSEGLKISQDQLLELGNQLLNPYTQEKISYDKMTGEKIDVRANMKKNATEYFNANKKGMNDEIKALEKEWADFLDDPSAVATTENTAEGMDKIFRDCRAVMKDFDSRKTIIKKMEDKINEGISQKVDLKLGQDKLLQDVIKLLLENQQRFSKLMINIGTEIVKLGNKAEKKAKKKAAKDDDD